VLLRRIVASSGQQDLNSSHLTFLADRAGCDVDATDP